MLPIETVGHLAAALKKEDIPYRELQIGDIICSCYGGVDQITKIEEKPDGSLVFLDANDNGTIIAQENLDWKVRIIPREFLAEEPYV